MGATTLGRERSQRAAAAKAVGRWSTSVRWEGCTKATAVPRIRHILRDVEEQQGLYRAHSNELIDPAMTGANLSFRPVVEADGSIRKERITSVEAVFDRMEESLEKVQRYRTVPEFRMVVEKDADGMKIPELDDAGAPVLDKKGKPVHKRRKEPMPNAGARVPVAMRKDTVVAVEELFQLDPEYTGSIKDMTPEMRKEVQGLYDVWYADLVDQYGAHNVLCVSEHWDETSPHVSAFCMPLAERADGTAELNAKLFLTGKKDPTRTEARDAYVAKHDRLREALRGAGYDATFERITPRNAQGFAEKGAPLTNFKRAAKRATTEEREGLAAERAELEARSAALDEREGEIGQRAADVEATTRRQVLAAMEGTARKAMADANRIRTDAETEAGQIVGAAQTRAEEIATETDAAVLDAVIAVEAVRDDVRGLDSDPARARALYEKFPLRGQGPEKIRDAAKVIKRRLADEHAALDFYDPARADAAMTAAKLDTMRKLKGPKRADGTERTVAEWVDEKTAERYDAARRPVPTETVAERDARLGAVVDGAADDSAVNAAAINTQQAEGLGMDD